MQLKVLSKQTLLIIILTGFAFSLTLFSSFVMKNFNMFVGMQAENSSALAVENTIVIPEQEQMNLFAIKEDYGLPVRLKIPSIDIDSVTEQVGLTSQGAMDVPKNQDNVAWFNAGPRPGENGSAVIAGHFGWKNGKSSAFDDLYKLRKGDKLYIKDEKGQVVVFVVRESRSYDANADASDVFSSSDGKAHLNLITCEGVWDKDRKSYSKRLVVFADEETK
jgi:LPXTG-site transpeptidase (sortase) family protein